MVSSSMIFFNYTLRLFFVHAFKMGHCLSKLNPQRNSSALRRRIMQAKELLCFA